MRCIKRSNIWSDVLICWRLERLMWKALRHFKDRIAIQLDWRSSSSSLKERKVQNIWQVIWCIYVHHLNKGTTQQLACSQFLPWPLWITSTTLWGGNRSFVKVVPTSTTNCIKNIKDIPRFVVAAVGRQESSRRCRGVWGNASKQNVINLVQYYTYIW